ncbi:hypothetical protein Taro_013896 [Colocasia esculenta]|uniref:Uncharacterized protein n=1 Tax=Colocasia esculenta TaxID=4460 RepID=A0A843UHF0_COLES|nr:hypothetical protein [Colocasia esculenta]
MSFTTCCGHVEEFLAAGEPWNDRNKLIFFPIASASTYANHPLGVNQRPVNGASRSSRRLGVGACLNCGGMPRSNSGGFPAQGDYDIQEEEQVEDGNASE